MDAKFLQAKRPVVKAKLKQSFIVPRLRAVTPRHSAQERRQENSFTKWHIKLANTKMKELNNFDPICRCHALLPLVCLLLLVVAPSGSKSGAQTLQSVHIANSWLVSSSQQVGQLEAEVDEQADRITRFAPEHDDQVRLRHSVWTTNSGQATDQRQASQLVPWFAIEPPSYVEYSNSSGVTLHCRPQVGAQVAQPKQRQRTLTTWRRVSDHLGGEETRGDTLDGERLLELRPDGSLTIKPFSAKQLDLSIHSAKYRCCLAIASGSTVCSRPVQTKAVIDVQVNLEVFDQVASLGQLAVFRCHSSQHHAEQLEITQWLRDDKLLPALDEIKLARRLAELTIGAAKQSDTHQQQQQQEQLAPKYLISQEGELIVRNVSKFDLGQYKCRARNRLTGRTLTSSIGGMLILDESTSKSSGAGELKIRALDPIDGQAKLLFVREHGDLLFCAKFQSAQQQELRKFQWFKLIHQQTSGLQHRLAIGEHQQQQQVSEQFTHLRPLESCLLLSRAQEKHAGDYVCEASDGQGNQARALFRLLVGLRPGQAHIFVQSNAKQPQQQAIKALNSLESGQQLPQQVSLVQVGSSVQLNCSLESQTLVATGQQQQERQTSGKLVPDVYNRIDWLKDGRLVAGWRKWDDHHEHDENDNHGERILTANNRDKQSGKFRLLRPNLLQVELFDLADRGLYQCQAYFWAPNELRASSSPRSSISASIFNASGENSDSYHQQVLQQIETKLEQQQRFTSSSAMVQLELALAKPQLMEKFPSVQTVNEEQTVSLECSASGLPVPKILWFLDEFRLSDAVQTNEQSRSLADALAGADDTIDDLIRPNLVVQDGSSSRSRLHSSSAAGIWANGLGEQLIQDQDKFQIKTWRPKQSNVIVSQLNVSSVRGAESGQYKCLASNSMGESAHSGRLNVLQRSLVPQTRAYQPTNLTLIAGLRSVLIQCPLAGFPLRQVSWFLNGRQLPLNHRQRIEPIRKQQGGQLELLNVDVAKSDEGVYTCAVQLDSMMGANTSGGAQARHQYDIVEQQLGQIQVNVRVAPLIDSQLLPEIVEAKEGTRTKLMCSVLQGEHPIEIKWLKRVDDQQKMIKLFADSTNKLAGYELLAPMKQSSEQSSLDSITIHNLEDSSLLTFRQVSQLDEGEYLCLAQNEFSVAYRQVQVSVHQEPAWSIEPPSEMFVLLGQRVQIDCLAHGNPAPSGRWSKAWSTSAPETRGSRNQGDQFAPISTNQRQRVFANGTLVLEQVEISDSALYMCEQTNSIGSGLSKLTRLQVQIAPHFRQQQTVYMGKLNGHIGLKCTVVGDQPMLIGWRKEEQVIDLVKDQRQRRVEEFKLNEQTYESTLSINNLTRADSGAYNCIASNELGTEELRLVLAVKEPPEAPSQIIRPVRAEARRATLTFTRPFTGNSSIRKYAIYLRPLSSNEHLLLGVAQSSMMEAYAEQLLNSSRPIYDQADEHHWQQVVIEAPQLQSAAELQHATSGEAANRTNQVDLNLCCLRPFTSYLVRMRAINDIGQSELSKPFLLITDEETIGGPPLDVGVEPTGAHSLKVRWRPPAKHLQNGLIRGYYIGYRPVSSGLANANLQSGFGASDLSATDQPQQFQYKNVQLDLIQWRQLAAFQSRQVPALSEFESDTLGNSTAQQTQALTSYLTNLKRKTTYSIIVQAYNKVGAGPRSDQMIVSTLDAAPPMSPLLKLVSVAYNSAQLTWIGRKFPTVAQQQQHLKASRAHSDELVDRLSGELYATVNDAELDSSTDDDPQSFYTLSYKLDDLRTSGEPNGAPNKMINNDYEWQQKRLTRPKAKQAPIVTLLDLRCGSSYMAYMTATNSLGQSEPGETVRFNTMGGAPVAPAHSSDFLQVNSSFVVLRLNEWRNAGCMIDSFLIRYKQRDSSTNGNNKWIRVEHQVHPTLQTIANSGNAFYSSARASAGGQSSPDVSTVDFRQQQLAVARQQFNDLILRSLQPTSEYQLVVEANSEAGSTVAEYEFETGNFSSTTIAININGLVASDLVATNEQRQHLMGAGGEQQLSARKRTGELLPNSDGQDYNLLSGGSARNTIFNFQMQGQKYSFGVWSLTVVFIGASIVMAITTLVLGFRSVWRMKRQQHRRRQSFDTSTRDEPASGQSMFGSLFGCNAPNGGSSASSSSTGGCSTSSTTGANATSAPCADLGANLGNTSCYQTSNEAHLSFIEASYCSLPATNNHLQLTDSPSNQSPGEMDQCRRYMGEQAASTLSNRIGAGQQAGEHCGHGRHTLAPSNSLSTLSSAATRSHLLGRHARALGGRNHFAATLNRPQRGPDCSATQEAGNEAIVTAANSLLRAHYPATLGRQHVQNGNSTFTAGQPIKFYPANNDSPLYGRIQRQSEETLLSPGAHYRLGTEQATSTSSGYATSTSARGQQHQLIDNNADETNNQQQVYFHRTQHRPPLAQVELYNHQQLSSFADHNQQPLCYDTQLALSAAEALNKQQVSSFLSSSASQQEQFVKDPYGVLFGQQAEQQEQARNEMGAEFRQQ